MDILMIRPVFLRVYLMRKRLMKFCEILSD